MSTAANKALRDVEIAQASIQPGMTYSDIANQFNLTQPRISQILQKPEIRAIVQEGTNYLISLVPLAIDNYTKILADPKHSDFYKANRDVLQNTGILPSHTGGNTYIQNVFNSTSEPTDIELNRFVTDIKGLIESDVMEAEYSEEG